MTQRLDFIDVSHWQGRIDWERVAATGDVLGAIAKCTDGVAFLDDEYQANRAGALDNGLAFAAYHYLQHGRASDQMEWFLSKAALREGERVVIDYEESDPSVSMVDLQEALEFLRYVRPDLQLTVYGASMLTEHCNACEDTSWLHDTSLWAARYSEYQPVWAEPPWQEWSAWQYSDNGKVDGINGDVDLNTFNGSRENCLKWFGPVDQPVPVPQPPYGQPTIISIQGDPATLVVLINGVEVEL